ncbi:MAG: hypothetical protein IJ791_06900 [Lachnospiraceae bacterium]|nr:hypothetical protein [Lachnospiraceae bacterium]
MREWNEYIGDELDYEEIFLREKRRLAAIRMKRAADDAVIEARKYKAMKAVAAVMTVCLAAGGVYAATYLFYKSQRQESDYLSKEIFEFNVNEFFEEKGEIGPGDSKTINPIVTSDSTVESFVVIVVKMLKFGDGGLYVIEKNDDWAMVQSWSDENFWFEAYQYNYTLFPGESTTPLGDKVTMVEMTGLEYGNLGELKIWMTAYACGTEGEDMWSAWGSIDNYLNP